MSFDKGRLLCSQRSHFLKQAMTLAQLSSWTKRLSLRRRYFRCICVNETFLNLFLRVQLTITEHCFRQWLDAEKATSYHQNQCWPDSLTHICDTRRRWVNTALFMSPNFILSPYRVTTPHWVKGHTRVTLAWISTTNHLRLAHLPRLPHTRVNESVQYWFR